MDVQTIKKDFPILSRRVHGKPLVYLDNAATSQKPRAVIEAMVDYYENHNANVHRGIHVLGDESTRMYGEARRRVAEFVGAQPEELVFVRNTTEAINLVGYAWARKELGEGDLVITSELEHHSDLVVWQEVARETGSGLTFVDVGEDGRIDMEHLEALLESVGDQVKLVALSWVSNATGSVLDVERVVGLMKKYAKSSKLLIDGAQAVPHLKVDFDASGIDFLAFSGHKMYGPMGIGGLVVKKEILKDMEPFMVGGGMINEVHLTGSSYGELPDRFDAGTPNVAGAVELAAACEYLDKIGMGEIGEHGVELVNYAYEELSKVGGIKLVGPNPKSKISSSKQITNSNSQNSKPSKALPIRLGSVAFTFEGVHAHDVAQVLDSEGIAVRSGHHCTMPLHEKFEWVATTRASFGIYNDKGDVDKLVEGLRKVKEVFK